MTSQHVVPQEIIAHLRLRFSEQGIDAKPVFVIGPDREDGQIEFFTGDGKVWPVVMRVGSNGLVPLADRAAEADDGTAAASVADAVDGIVGLLRTSAPKPLRDPALAAGA
ncbi:hypothetical protein [Caenispirillum bisanense]|uniref:hypothetical protein n=1 Tax=Caenispirillum bisanense TaxID=414052 RepID=UPI0031DD5011